VTSKMPNRAEPATRTAARIAVVGPVDCHRVVRELHKTPPEDLPQGRAGAASVVTTAVIALAHRGVRTHIVTTDTSISTIQQWHIDDQILTVVPARASGFARDLHAWERRSLRQAIESIPVDLVHAHWTYEYALASLRVRPRRPVVVSVHDWPPALLRLQPHFYNVFRLGMLLWVAPRADALLVNSPYLEQRLARYGARPRLIPNPMPERSFEFERSHQPRIPRSLLAVNVAFNPTKNVTALMEAFQYVRAEEPSVRMRLVGPPFGPGGPAETWAKNRGCAEGVDFVGELDHAAVRQEMRAASLFVHPSREESFGQVLVEALAVGTPVLGGLRSGAVPWVLDSGEAGRLVDVEDHQRLAAGIIAALREPNLHEEGERGRARTWDRFRSSVIADQLLEVYGRHGFDGTT
jgi:L-malate glycosyltransferase